MHQMEYLRPFITSATAAIAAMARESTCRGSWSCAIRRGLALQLDTGINDSGESRVDFTLILGEQMIALNNGLALPDGVQPERIANAIIALTNAMLHSYLEIRSGDSDVRCQVETTLDRLDQMLQSVEAVPPDA